MEISPFTSADIEELAALQPEGWTDIKEVYKDYLLRPYCFPLKLKSENKLIGVGVTITHINSAWLAQIIVHPDHRKQGLGTLITKALLDKIDTKAFPAISLIATPLGEPVYQKLGFRKTAEYLLLKSENKVNLPVKGNITRSSATDYASIMRLDKLASGEDRTKYLKQHLSSAKLFTDSGIVRGFYLPTLLHGPVIAFDAEAGIELMKFRQNTSDDSAVLPSENKEAIDFLLQQNYKVVNRASRMSLGQPINFKPEMIFNRISGSLG